MNSNIDYKLVCADHLYEPLDPESLPDIVARIIAKIKETATEFDSIAFKGMSGALVAPIVAFQLKKHLIFLRSGDKCHSTLKVEGYLNRGSGRYIIVDDLIFSGNTCRTIQRSIHENWRADTPDDAHTPCCMGIFIYAPSFSFAHELGVPIYKCYKL